MSVFKGVFRFHDISSKGQVDVECTQADPWVKTLLERSAPESALTGLSSEQWAAKAQYQATMKLEEAGSDVRLHGNFKAEVTTPCSRCGDLYQVPREADFQLFVHREDDREDEDGGDPDYIVVPGDEIDLREILAEQLMVQEPVAECPARKPDGSCSLCHKNPQFENQGQFAGQASEKKADSPFASLKNLKLKKG